MPKFQIYLQKNMKKTKKIFAFFQLQCYIRKNELLKLT